MSNYILTMHYAKITDEYSAKILNWAVKKTGNRTDGEDLAQEVFLQVFVAVSKQDKVEKLENFIWKTAYYVWCNHVRILVRRRTDELPDTLPDGTDFARDYAENDALQAELSYMRRKIADLSKLQREAVILHYLDGLPVREVAARLNITETAAEWHLFDARKKVKKELETMKNENTYVHSPGRLIMAAVGNVPKVPDTDKINDSLIRQNVCLLCRGEGKTIDELAGLLGISKPYLEFDLDWLADCEFLSFDGRRYQTAFIITDKKHSEYRNELYLQNINLFKKLTEYIWTNENKIRDIGFYGSDFPMEKLMWSLLML
ncbi:MAG: RNA polymerase sigma factor, partial [Oscillospiraceae bacterium]|nr:RNA polymerase sigma factor [Oscillospiraceae bacterium]